MVHVTDPKVLKIMDQIAFENLSWLESKYLDHLQYGEKLKAFPALKRLTELLYVFDAGSTPKFGEVFGLILTYIFFNYLFE